MNNTEKIDRKKTWIDISKLFLFLYIVYGKALVPLGYQYGRLSSILLIVSFGTCILYDNGKIVGNKLIRYELIFIAGTTLTSVLIARDRSLSISVTEQLLEATLVAYIIFRIALKDKGVEWMLYAWVCTALILAVFVISSGGYVQAGGRISISDTMNVNTLGMIMALGIWSILFLYPKKLFYLLGTIITVAIVALFLYVAIITASRKAIIISVVIIFLWYIYCLRVYLKQVKFSTKLSITVLLIVAIVFVVAKFGNSFIASSFMIQQRMQRDYLDYSSSLRVDLIYDALKVFAHNFLIGVGWNNYKLYSAYMMYSHSSYIELLACTGIVGTFLSLIWIGAIAKGFIRIHNKDYQYYCIGVLILVLLVDFAMQIVFYNPNLLYMLSIIMAYTQLQYYSQSTAE